MDKKLYYSYRYLEMPGCKHAIENEKLTAILDDKIIGIPECPSCNTPISNLPRFKEKFKSRKKDVVQVFDHYFILKSNLTKTKQLLLQDFDLELCEDNFKNHVSARCQDKSSPMTLSGIYSVVLISLFKRPTLCSKSAIFRKVWHIVNL